MIRHKLDDQLVFSYQEEDRWTRFEQTLCGISITLPGPDLSCTYTGDFDCEDCKAVYALQLLADLP